MSRTSPKCLCDTAVVRPILKAVVCLVSLGWMLGACSSGGSVGVMATYVPASMPFTSSELSQDAATLSRWLLAMGDQGAVVSVHGSRVVISGGGILPLGTTRFLGSGQVFFRPVLCGAPAYSPASGTSSHTNSPIPSCGAQYLTNESNLGIVPNGSPQAYQANSVPADPSFSSVPSTPPVDDNPNVRVLLSADPAAGAQQYRRFVLGLASVAVSSFTQVQAVFDNTISQWAVTYTLTPSGSPAWDQMAHENFHRYIGIDIGGLVESAPLIQPQSVVFSSFEGKGEISGSFTRVSAQRVATELEYALAIPLVPARQ